MPWPSLRPVLRPSTALVAAITVRPVKTPNPIQPAIEAENASAAATRNAAPTMNRLSSVNLGLSPITSTFLTLTVSGSVSSTCFRRVGAATRTGQVPSAARRASHPLWAAVWCNRDVPRGIPVTGCLLDHTGPCGQGGGSKSIRVVVSGLDEPSVRSVIGRMPSVNITGK